MDEVDEPFTTEEMYHVKKVNDEVYKRFARLMPTNDLTLIVLKGHLLVEEQMDKFIESSLGEAAGPFDSIGLQFKRKWKFAKQLHRPRDLFPEIWGSVNELNELRNAIAHNPEVADLAQRCAKFVERVVEGEEVSVASMNVNQESRLVFAIGSIVANLAGIRVARHIALRRYAESK